MVVHPPAGQSYPNQNQNNSSPPSQRTVCVCLYTHTHTHIYIYIMTVLSLLVRYATEIKRNPTLPHIYPTHSSLSASVVFSEGHSPQEYLSLGPSISKKSSEGTS